MNKVAVRKVVAPAMLVIIGLGGTALVFLVDWSEKICTEEVTEGFGFLLGNACQDRVFGFEIIVFFASILMIYAGLKSSK